MTYKLGSLFDGSGGFPLAGSLCGVEPVWAAEVEPYPIAVTRSRFPSMQHLGDISKINGGEIEPVDIITFGSPCQDLSVAGKRAGLKHEANGDEETTRSGLFMEAVRIIKEMREKTNGRYPTFALWENVPGAFSSNKGEDFRIVCEELIKIVEPSASMPPVPKNGWPYADSYCGDGWSLAYRVFDAQYWGVPQRRRRIHLVLDLRGQRAREVLFEREGVRGYFAQGGTPWQAIAGDAEGGVGADDREGNSVVGVDLYNQVLTGNVSKSMTASASDADHVPCVAYTLEPGIAAKDVGIVNAIGGNAENYQVNSHLPTLTNGNAPGFMNAVAYPVPNILLDDQGGQQITVRTDDKCPTLRAEAHGNVPCVLESAGFCTEHSAKSRGVGFQKEVAPTLRAGVTPACVYSIENHPADSRVSIVESGKVQTRTSRMGTGGGNVPMVMEAVPTQGFGDYKDCGIASGLKARDYKDATDLVTEAVCGVTSGAQFTGRFTPKAETLRARDYKEPQMVCYEDPIAIDRAFFNQGQNAQYEPQYYTDGTVPTLVARGPSAVAVRYIVRRLTPTECARLQGFADRWGDIDGKDVFTPDEFQFWREVRQTHDAINGKKRQEYTEKQILVCYNKLHIDSAEYKMWGNGIALPPALYCLQGITDALKEYSNEPEVEKKFDMEKAVEEIDNSSVMLAYARIWKNRKHLTRQQMKTLKGQIKAGDTDAAMRGLDKLLRGAKA